MLMLLPLSLFLVLAPSFIKQLLDEQVDLEKEKQQLDLLIAQMEVDTTLYDPGPFNYKYKMFDPNHISGQELEMMGVDKGVASNWERYLASGGKFYAVDDIKKVYGLSAETFGRIRDYVKIKVPAKKEMKQQFSEQVPAEERRPAVSTYTQVSKKAIQPFDINKADTMALKQLKGIGSVFSKRILKYRESLGGFVSKDQLKEIWGLNEAVLAQLDTLVYIDQSLSGIRLLAVNEATEQQLARHPYLSNNQAGAIVAYRYQHGKFHQVSDLYHIHRLDSATVAKLAPYLEF
ncbi:hypothetical protein GCM10009122_45590 [Fulvivirga kasyanovii]